MASEKTIDGYADALTDWRGEAVRSAAAAIRAAAPEATGTIKWAQPVFESNGPVRLHQGVPEDGERRLLARRRAR